MPLTSRTNRAIAIGSLALLAVAWGAIPLFVRAEVPASHLVAMRVTLGGAVLVLFSMATKRFTIPRHRWRGVAMLGAVLAAHWLSFFVALNLTTVAVTLAILYVGPVLAAVLSGPVLHERVSWHAYVGLVVAVVGTLLVIRPGSGATVAGVAVAAISGVLLAVIMLLGKPLAGALSWQPGSSLSLPSYWHRSRSRRSEIPVSSGHSSSSLGRSSRALRWLSIGRRCANYPWQWSP